MFKTLVLHQLPLSLLPAYAFGSMVGSLIGIAISIPLEKFFNALSDDHVLGQSPVSTQVKKLA
jgi:hypothetical protein